jgi:hypothetical protein
MKNIHLQKTDKPSRLKQNKITKKISLVNKGIDLTSYTPINIYITSDVEIKEGDWILDIELNRIEQCLYSGTFRNWKKIILTTDQNLIADGVQAIDDEFLEWFVNNPSCEEVEVSEDYFKPSNMVYGIDMEPYKIIIPKEEPKQETLEEFIDKVDTPADFDQFTFDEGIRVGVKWQQEQNKKLYSEEDLVHLLDFVSKEYNISNGIGWFHTHESIEDIPSIEVLGKWFEQFKKK